MPLSGPTITWSDEGVLLRLQTFFVAAACQLFDNSVAIRSIFSACHAEARRASDITRCPNVRAQGNAKRAFASGSRQ